MKKLKPAPYKSDMHRHKETIGYSMACITAGLFALAIVAIFLLPVIWYVIHNVILSQP